jgi:integrase
VDTLGFNDTGEIVTNDNGEKIPVKISDLRQRIVFHSLRHTHASWLVQRGTPLYEVAKLLGHSTIRMTERYSHLAPDSLRKAALGLQGSLEKKQGNVLQFPNVSA